MLLLESSILRTRSGPIQRPAWYFCRRVDPARATTQPRFLPRTRQKRFFPHSDSNMIMSLSILRRLLLEWMSVRRSSFIDSYILVIEWGATKVDAVQYALRHAPGVQENIVGAVLNKVNMTAMGRYDSYGANYYYGQPGTRFSALTMLHVDRRISGSRGKREVVSRPHPAKERVESRTASRRAGI